DVRVSTGLIISISKVVPAGSSVVRSPAYVDGALDAPLVTLDEEPLGCAAFVPFGGAAPCLPSSGGAVCSGGVSVPYPWPICVESFAWDMSVCAFFWQAETANAKRTARSEHPRIRIGFIWIHRPFASR